MTTMQQLSASQANKELRINENFEALSAGAIYSKRHAVTSGLTWGYYGGLYNGATIADGTVTLTNTADNYVVVLRSSGVVSVSTSSANSLNSLYTKLYKLTTAGSVVTVELDQRMDTNGLLFDTAGGGGGSVTSVSVTTANGVSGTVATATTTPAITLTLGAITPTAIVASGAVSGSNLSGTNTGDQSLAAYATSAYVDAALAGLSWKQAVRAATTANGTLATAYENGDTIDGVVLATGDRILLKNQTAGAENGIYLVAASGAPTRSTDANSSAELVNASVYVSEGTTLADTQWTCSTNAPITVDTTTLVFAQLNSGSGTTVATDVIWDAAGDLVQGTGANTAARLALGTALQVLRVNAGATAAEWAAAASGSTQGRHAIYIAAGSISPSVAGGCAALAGVASAANQPDIRSLDFDTTTQEYAQFSMAMPKSWDEGTVTFAPVWSHAATVTNFGVVWDLQGVAVSNDDAIAVAFGTAVTSTDTGGTTNDVYMGPESAAITIAGTPAAEDTVFFRLSRVTGNGSDTMAIDARLHGIVLYMTTNADTDT